MRELAVQARNGTNGAKDQVSLNKEFVELGKEIDRVIKGADFNGKKILSTDATTDGFTFQVGANTSAQDTIKVTTTNLGTDTDIAAITGASIGNTAAAALDATALATVIGNLDTALDKVNSERAVLGPPRTASRPWSRICKWLPRTPLRPAAASWMPTSLRKPPT